MGKTGICIKISVIFQKKYRSCESVDGIFPFDRGQTVKEISFIYERQERLRRINTFLGQRD